MYLHVYVHWLFFIQLMKKSFQKSFGRCFFHRQVQHLFISYFMFWMCRSYVVNIKLWKNCSFTFTSVQVLTHCLLLDVPVLCSIFQCLTELRKRQEEEYGEGGPPGHWGKRQAILLWRSESLHLISLFSLVCSLPFICLVISSSFLLVFPHTLFTELTFCMY